METWWFSKVIAKHPYVILVAVLVFSSTCLIVPLATKKFPDFSDPQLGFEARGTVLAQRLMAWKNLMDATEPRGELVNDPYEYYRYLQEKEQVDVNKNETLTEDNVRKKPRNKSKKKGKKFKANNKDSNNGKSKDTWEELMELKNKDRDDYPINGHEDHNHLDEDGFFCNLPSSSYARVIIGSENGEHNLWSMEGVLAQCHIDAVLRSNAKFPKLCQTQTERSQNEQRCCRSWSPANYVALLSNRTSCLGVTEGDLNRVSVLLQRCAYFYHNLQLTPDCSEDIKCQRRVPADCYLHNAPYHLLHYLLDSNFMENIKQESGNKTVRVYLRSAMIFLPIAASSGNLDYYRGLSTSGLTYGNFRVLGMELGLKDTLFDRLLVSDSSLLLSGFAFVTICIWTYTGSILLTISTILAVIFSLGISYAWYTLVLRIKFFPFMNLLAIVVAIGIGADDAFIYCKVWESSKQQKLNGGVVQLVQETMKHALPSMFVTTITTVVAFFASIVSNVTAINCFSLFSGMTVIANFFLMITWLPASVVVAEGCRLTILSPANFLTRKVIRPLRAFSDTVALEFSNILIQLTIRLRWLWLLLLCCVTIVGCAVTFRYPGLQLPDSPDFQLFDSTHPFEQYTLVYARRFWFERLEMAGGGEVLPLRFVWGVKPVDNGDYLDPIARGTLEWDDSFDVSSPESQTWLQQFCHNLRTQHFYRSTLGPLLPNCFIESLKSWMERRCEDPIDAHVDRFPCCEESKFPYQPAVLEECAAEASAELYRTPASLWAPGGSVTAGLKFLKKSFKLPMKMLNHTKRPVPKIRALIVEYDSTYAFSLSFTSMNEFFLQIESWMQKQLATAPKGMTGGWFVSRLEFYELQRTLYQGTIWAMGLSMALSLIVLTLVTLNLLVSLYAIIAIGAIIIVTIAALVLLGWKLNVLESVAVSTAIGLAVDFSLHYGVNFRRCESEDRMEKVKAALENMGGPTLMAAVTTGAAGALMLPSHVLAYIQIGVFLLLVMGVSWFYATFFLCSLLAIMGPSNNFLQFQYPKFGNSMLRFRKDLNTHDAIEVNDDSSVSRKRDRRKGMLSESTLSTSSTACQLHCCELEALSLRPQPSLSLPPSPTSALLHFDSNNQTNLRNSRRRNINDLD